MKYLYCVYIVLFFCACNSERSDCKQELSQFLKVSFSGNVTITDNESSGGIQGKWVNSCTLHFSKKEFQEIFIKTKPEKVSEIDSTYIKTEIKGGKITSALFSFKDNSIKFTYAY